MKKAICWITILLAISLVSIGYADFALPASIKVIEEEAFMGDSSITGIVSLPISVEQVKKDAFSGTKAFAMEIPESVLSINSQSFVNAGYLFFHGNTAIDSFTGIHYIIGPEQSNAAAWANNQQMEFVPINSLIEYNGFYYREDASGLRLMSAVNPDQLGSFIQIPQKINDKDVTSISAFAFVGCDKVQKVILSNTLLENWNSSEHDDFSEIEFESYSETLIRKIEANTSSGTIGKSITWSVETEEAVEIIRYDYSLTLNGTIIDEKTSQDATYTYTPVSAGIYQLYVLALADNGAAENSSSSLLYIASENMKMTVPSSIENGEDLSVNVLEVPGAYFYGVYLTEESTGKSIGYKTIDRPGTVTFDGYLLNNGKYRVTGYVFGNDFRYTVPTVKTVTVSGTKTAGPTIQNENPAYLNREYLIPGSDAEKQVAVYQFQNRDGTLSEEMKVSGSGDLRIRISSSGIETGGKLLIKRTVKKNGKWTSWCPTAEIDVLTSYGLATPLVTCPVTWETGKDLTFSFESVEDANRYEVGISKDSTSIYFDSYNKAQQIIIPGYNLSNGQYTLTVSAFSENRDRYSSYIQFIDITGTRPDAPSVSVDKTERYISGGNVLVTVQAPGAEGANIERVILKNGKEYSRYGIRSISLDENGNGTFRDTTTYSEDYAGCTLSYQVTTIQDGIWSEYGSAEVLLKRQDPLPEPVIDASTTHVAGMDYTFHFNPVEEADSYNVYFRQYYSNDYICSWYSDAKPNKDLTVPGYYLTQGTYRLRVEAYSSERGNSEKEIIITVTGSRPSAPIVTVNKDEFHIKDRLVFTANTADAEELIIYYGRYGNECKRFDISNDETTWRYTVSESYLDVDLTFRFSLKKNGVWSAWKEFTKTVQNLPPLDTPVIHASPTYEAGEDIIISFDTVENAQSYSYRLYWNDDSTGQSCSEPQVVSYSGADYEPGNYRFTLIASSNNYASSTAEVTFRITGNKAPWSNPSLSSSEVMPGDKFTFEFNTENVDAIRYKAYRINDGETWTYQYGSINVIESTTKWSRSIGDTGEYSYIFSALIDDHWSSWTSPVYIKVLEPEETTGLPSVELPVSHLLGQDLTVTIGSMEKAKEMYISLYNSNGTQIGYKHISGNAGGTVTFDGYALSLGKNRVEIEIYTGSSWYYIHKQLTVVSNSRPKAPEVVPDTEVGRVGIRFGFTINSTGADKIAVRYYKEDNTNSISYDTKIATDNLTYWNHYQSTSGTVWKYSFSVRIDGIWSSWSSINTVRISDREQLIGTTIHGEDTLEAGQDLYFSFDEVENAEYYTAYLYYPDGSYSYWNNVSPNMERRVIGYNLTPGNYRITIVASATDYESSISEKNLTVIGDRPSAPNVTVSSQEVFSDEAFTFVIESVGAEEIAYRRSYNNGVSGYSYGTLNVWILSDPTVWETSIYGTGSVNFCFSVLREGKWSNWSTPLEISVKTRPTLAIPEIIVPNTITQGENLTVTVSAVENASSYYIYLYDNREKQIASKYLSSDGSAVFSGYLLPVGSLRVSVEAYGSNSASSRTSCYVKVITGLLPDAPVITPPESLNVPARTYYEFSIGTENVEKAAVRYFRIGAPNDLYYSEFNVDSGETTSWRGYQYNSGVKFAYSFSTLKNGVWSEWSPFTVITIE